MSFINNQSPNASRVSVQHRDWNWRIGPYGAVLGPLYFFGFSPVAAGTVSGPALDARNAFNAATSARYLCTYEGFAPVDVNADPIVSPFVGDPSARSLSIFAESAASAGSRVRNIAANGRFNTTPAGAFYVEVGTNGLDNTNGARLVLSAPSPIFGFYGTDFGDFNAEYFLELTTSAGTFNTSFPVPLGPPDGCLLFWGVVFRDGTTISQVRVTWTSPDDVPGFDDLIVGLP